MVLLEYEDGEPVVRDLRVLDDSLSMQVLHSHQFRRGSASSHGMEARCFEDCAPKPPFSSFNCVRRSLSTPASIDALSVAYSRQTSMSITASSNTNNNGEVRIQILEDGETSVDNKSPLFCETKTEVIKPLLNCPRLTEVFLVIAAQVALTLCTIRGSSSPATGSGSSVISTNSILLRDFAMACNAIGFLCCLYGILLCGRKPGVAARSLTGLGYFAIAYGLLAVMALQLKDHVMLWITFAACIASFPALAAAFRK